MMQYNKIDYSFIHELNMVKKMFKHNKNGIVIYGRRYHSFNDVLEDKTIWNRQNFKTFDAVIIFCKLFYKKCTRHYFIEDNLLYDFLKKTKVNDIEALKHVMVSAIQLDYDQEKNIGHYAFGGTIYSQTDESPVSFLFTKVCEENTLLTNNNHTTLTCFCGDGYYCLGREYNIETINNFKFGAKYVEWLRLIINMFLYSMTFPDKIKEGAPVGQPIRYDESKSYIIRTASQITDNSGVTPHFRRGHFRLLQSDRFKNKKGEIVFVRSAFVNGKAVTIQNESIDNNIETMEV